MQSPLRVTVGGHLPIYCIAVQGVPIPEVQWHSEGLPVHPLSSFYQQIYVVPTDSPRTTTYTCIGTTFSRGVETSELRVNVTVIVEGKLILYGYTLYVVIFKGLASLCHSFLFEDSNFALSSLISTVKFTKFTSLEKLSCIQYCYSNSLQF